MAWFKCMGGSYTDYSNKTVTASAVTSDSNYTYLTIPNEGIYNTGSKVRTLNSNLGGDLNNYEILNTPATSSYGTNWATINTNKPMTDFKYILVMRGFAGNFSWQLAPYQMKIIDPKKIGSIPDFVLYGNGINNEYAITIKMVSSTSIQVKNGSAYYGFPVVLIGIK